jgi:manganese transport protein
MAGQMIAQGFVGFRIPLWLRRAITMVPSLIIVALSVNVTKALIDSQVVLSLALPFPMIALVWFTGRKAFMGPHRNRAPVQVLAILAVFVVLTLNATLVAQAVGIDIYS